MPKFIALIASLLVFLAVPALASADPTASSITTPGNPSFVTYDSEHPVSLHVAGTTSGGAGNVDVRCYFGMSTQLLASSVPVVNGAFATDVSVTKALVDTTLGYPYPYCTLRAVPAGTTPQAPPNAVSPWQGPALGWGAHEPQRLGSDAPNAPDTIYDYFIARTQSAAMNDFWSVGSCGLCDTFLMQPGTKARANPIWWANGGLYLHVPGITDRGAAIVDGVNAYSGTAAYNAGPNHNFADDPGFPAVAETDTVDPVTGALSIDEHSPYAKCAEDPSVFPATDASCASFASSGVELERNIRTSDNGLQVTIVDHWKSSDGKSHDLDAIYDDTERSTNASFIGHEGRANFTWTQDGMTTYPANTQIPVPPNVPATMVVKTDASTPDPGDNMNPFGAMTFGSQPSAIKLLNLGTATNKTGEWQAHYQRTIPAGGEVTIAVAYSAGFALDSVNDLAKAAANAVAAPTLAIDSPADGSTINTATAHVTGSASAADGQASVKVNGIAAPIANGQWSVDVPLSDGANQLTAVASNALGITASASRSVTRVAPAAPATPASTAVVAAKPVRCVVPKLRGKKLAAAKRMLKHAHCRLGKVAHKATTKVKPGRVVATRFKAGTRHPAGTRVRITVAKAR